MTLIALLLAACGSQGQTVCSECSQASAPELTFAVIGDFPYSAAQQQEFPQVVRQINADSEVALVFHVGDIRDEGPCDTSVYRRVKATFDKFSAPLVYTFGDNDWADCSKSENGAYKPLERLATLRRIFMPKPAEVPGSSMPVSSLAKEGQPENVSFVAGDLSFGVFHAVGDRNDLEPWAGETATTPQQRADEQTRVTNAETVVDHAFDAAHEHGSRAVVLVTHADMFGGPATKAKAAPFRPIVRKIASQAVKYSGRVYLINGDSHAYNEDQPLNSDSNWAWAYDVRPVDNLTRITVDGADNANNYLRLTAEPHYVPVLSWTRTSYVEPGGTGG